MPVPFNTSTTKDNLMRAFAGESQARNRYTFAASQAKKSQLHVVECVFTYTAGQEKEHAEIYYNLLKDLAGENILVDGKYPVDLHSDVVSLLRSAQHNEYQEHDREYAHFGDVAQQEGYPNIATTFRNIAAIEKTHGDRFGHFADLMDQGKLFSETVETEWLCLNCGHIHRGKSAPALCPVCSHDQGYFIRLSMSPYQG